MRVSTPTSPASQRLSNFKEETAGLPAVFLRDLAFSAHNNQGDVMEKSLWNQTCEMPKFRTLEENIKTDVLIVGGGLAGLLCAHQLKQDRVDCTVIEADRICSGVSGNTTAKITSQHGLIYGKMLRRFGHEIAKGYWQANQEAIEAYRILAGDIDCGFEEKDNFVYAVSSTEKLEQELECLNQLRIPASFEEDLPIPVGTVGAICFPCQAQFHPLKFAAGIASDLKIFEHTKAKEFIGTQVRTNRGTITAEKIIIATHFPMLNKHGAYYLKQYQSRSYVLALQNTPQVEGMYLGIDGAKLSFRNYGDCLVLGGGGHRTGKRTEGWNQLENFVKIHYPDAEIVSRWAAQDCMTLDDIPYIGQYSPNTPNLYVATGFNKWGMTSSMVAAKLLADLVQGRGNPYEQIFCPDRSILRPQILCNAAESAVNLLTPTKPRCPHLGCALKWNRQEHSWDCPCHGSRFSERGELLDNPATDDLKTE
jgi:glycine/D-amino acid oxidase-like deaminating enzyme